MEHGVHRADETYAESELKSAEPEEQLNTSCSPPENPKPSTENEDVYPEE